MKRYFSLSTIAHIIIVLLWSLGFKYHTVIDNNFIINIISYCTIILSINGIYLFVMSSNLKDILKKQSYIIIPIIIISTLLFKKSADIWILCFAYGLYTLTISLKKRKYKYSLLSSILYLISSIGIYFNIIIFSTLLITVATIVEINTNYGFKNFNIIPIANEKTGVFTVFIILLFAFLIYIFDLDSIESSILMNFIIIIFELLIILNLEEYRSEKEKYYKDIKELYIISEYISKERESFADIIHEEILQDIISSYNLLEYNEPDIEKSKAILKSSQEKLRSLMNFYNTAIFLELGMYNNIESIVESVRKIYPDKDMDLQIDIEDDFERNINDSELIITILKISKELLNNAFKHSKGEYIDFKIYTVDKEIYISCENNGVTLENYKRAMKSKNGLLVLKLMIEKYNGVLDIDYILDKLIVSISLGGKDEYTTF